MMGAHRRSSAELLVPLAAFTCILLHCFGSSDAVQELTPPYFNLAEGRKIHATSTCGVDTNEPELYCKLVGANTENDNHLFSVIQGQVCDYCDPSKPDRSHPAEHAIDGTENWWQSPPLSRGMKYNEVNLTIDFGQEFHVAYLFIRMANSPRPGLWTLEKSSDYGKTWKPWQHFSDTPADCETFFGRDSLKPITADDDVICTTEYSKIVPLENGEIPVTLLNNRPSAKNYFNSTALQEWTRATNVRFRFYRTKNLLGHLMSVARQDPTVTRRYFYSIKDISIGGRCMCNGHADTCHVLDPLSPTRILACQCHHNTCGIQCADCCPGYEQKKWHQNTNARPFKCEPCNCHGHSNTCVYDEKVDADGLSLDIHGRYDGGGVCQECQHNTEGINCNKCKSRFYRPGNKQWNETDVCKPCDCDNFYSTGNCAEGSGRCECKPEFQEPDCRSCSYGHFGYPNCRPCECHLNGTEGYHCESVNGICPCRPNFSGRLCNKCADGYYNFPECASCDCDHPGSISDVCHSESGQCECSSQFDGQRCERCKNGYFNYPECTYCNCDIEGTLEEVCDKDAGKCLCKEGFGGPRCDQCIPGYYNYPNCEPCNCSVLGSVSTVCDATGKCPCLTSFAGKQCTQCSAGYYSYPECLPCNCEAPGAIGISCNSEGQCLCSSNFDEKTCSRCKEGFYNYPACEECNCDPAGITSGFSGCGSVPAGELCQCKERVAGRICNECKPLYWNLNISNPDGCEECDCFIDGTIGALDTCNSKTGQCPCKPSVKGRTCKECKDGSFDLYGGNLFGCKDCGCDIGGSVNGQCNKATGQCKCHPRVAGRTCSHPLTTHYFPTLFQHIFEYEYGYTVSGAAVRYQFDEKQFPNFSQRGYAKFSTLQPEVRNEVNIFRSSVYRMVIRFVNPSQENIVAKIVIQSDNPSESDQHSQVLFKPTLEPQFVTVSGSKGEIPSPIVLDPGRYTFSVQTDKSIFLDYFVLLPAAYYEATILTKKIENPCELGSLNLCRHYKYPSINEFGSVYEPFITDGGKAFKPNEFYTDPEHLKLIKEKQLPVLSAEQPNLSYIVDVPRTGRYIVVVDYITDRQYPDTSIITVNLADSDQGEGVVTLYPCTYTTVCRQPAIDDESREKVFYLDNTDLKAIEIKSDGENRVAIKSVTAIPIHEWSIDLITPSPVCVVKDGKCVQATFQGAPDSKKIEFEHEHESRVASSNPVDLYDNSTKLIFLDDTNSTIEIQSKVPSPGRYNIIVKFFQPNYAKFDIVYKIDADKLSYHGKLNLRNCPSNSGCRELIVQDNGINSFDVEDNITLTFTNIKPKGAWFDYILIIPTEQFHDNILREDTFDQTKEFIQKCGHDHFHIQLNASEFCKQAVFSLTSDYNSGALPCNCDYEGSTSFECDPFGGQCQCKPNIIGRRCEACRTGFYGFPDCKKCDCPSTALCEKETGACICPPHVTGDKCDKCEPYTFGFDQITGCELCNCDPLGVQHGDLQCDLSTGTCGCRPHIEGRNCDKCQDGFFNFPHCEPCRCSVEGTTFEVCDKDDETCFCKKNVQGQACNQCVDGTYDLQQSNPLGCTKCFCFGKTSRCDRAYLRPFNVSMLKDASINTIEISSNGTQVSRWPLSPQDIFVNETLLEADLTLKDNDEGLVYFGVLDYLLDQNNHLTAYGGYLTYNLYYTAGLFGSAIIGPDVVFEGKGIEILHQSYEQPASAQLFRGSVRIVESSFTTVSGAPVTREVLMGVLRDLNAIYVRATYWEGTVISRLSDVYLTMADDDADNYNLYEELSVERCQCPPGYTGNSCEDCATGYYRDPNGPYGGYCLPCQCNGHADSCDCNTGICQTCKHNTYGDHCEKCIVGYHGNATFGSPNDCMICACPMPIESNNFATACEISEDGDSITCTCRPGYTGARCQSCAWGFYGQPQLEGDYCRPCQCSGNINPDEPGSCDSVTGECLRCLNNTSGEACNLCQPGFYGDAIKLKNCQSCVCDKVGTEHCDSFIGTCNCHRNVIGSKCDRCEDDHYGFTSGQGCLPCDCGVATNSTQCDDLSGECRCKPGVTGRQCDRCLPGYWNYTSEGCLSCSCNNEFSRGVGCNVFTGQCECLPGVIGEKCDACPHRWVLVPDAGCHECDICHHALLDVTDALAKQLNPVIVEFETVAGGFFTAQKLNYFDELTRQIEPEVKSLDPNGVNLTPFITSIEGLEQDAKSFERKATYAEQTAKEQRKAGAKLVNETNAVLVSSDKALESAHNTIYEVEKLADSLDASESTKADAAIAEAQAILDQILEQDIDTTPSEKQLEVATNFLAEIEKFSEPVKEQSKKLDALSSAIGNFSDKLEDLHEWSYDAIKKSNEAEALHAKNLNANVNSKFDTLANQTREAQKNVEDTNLYGKKGDVTLGEVFRHLGTLENVNNELEAINKQVDDDLPDKEEGYKNLHELIDSAVAKQNDLVHSANDLKSQLSNITSNSETALKAANAYSDITDAVNEARNAVKSAKLAAGNSTELTSGIENRAGEADKIARELLEDARKSLNTVQAELQPHLDGSAETVDEIVNKNTRSDKQLEGIQLALDQIPTEPQTNNWNIARDQAEEASEKSLKTKEILTPILETISQDVSQAKLMPNRVDDTNKDIAQASSQVERVSTLFPNLQTLVADIRNRHDETEKLGSLLGDRIESLKKQIEMARDIANGIKVGVNFHPNTTLELQPPPSLPSLAANSKVSAFVRTEKPNGFLLYLGNENRTGIRGKRADFMALEVENGYPILTIDLGNGPEKVISNKNIANGQWHQVIVERNGKDVSLSVREQVEDDKEQLHEVHETLLGNENEFDLDSANTKLFVGGYSPDFNAPEGLKYSSFEGQIEDLKINDQEVGLWNFVDGQDNNHGAIERDVLIESQIPPTGYRFSGHGYVILSSKQYAFKTRSSIQFKFKASPDSNDGLLFYAGKHKHFISVELRDGGVLFQYKLGQHSVQIATSSKFNDDQWHRVEADRDGRTGVLKVDGRVIYQRETPVNTEENLKISDSMYFGGHPSRINHTEVTPKNFDGCIDDVYIAGTPVDLSRNLKAYAVRPGCAKKFSQILSYPARQFGYLRNDNVTSNNHFQINLKFKTKQGKGILFYATDSNQDNTIGLTLEDGVLVLNCQRQIVSSTPRVLNDGEWHVVRASIDAKHLRLVVDETDEYWSEEEVPKLFIDGGHIYFGGLPKGFKTPRGHIGSPAYFLGCISDVYLSSSPVNFAESIDRKSAILDNCSRDILEYDPIKVPIVYPEDNVEPDVISERINEIGHGSDRDRDLEEEERKREEDERQRAEDERKREEDNERRRLDEVERERLAEAEARRRQEEEEKLRQELEREEERNKETDENTVVPTTVRNDIFSTTFRAPKRKPPPPKNNTICRLPTEPFMDVDFDSGYRFGTAGSSRIEFDSIPAKIKKAYDISLQFRTTEPDGILFYAADNRHTDFIALYLQNGYLIHSFNCGSGSANMTSKFEYNNDKWHTVLFSRQQSKGKLIINGDDEVFGESMGNTRTMSVQPPYSFGGVDPQIEEDSHLNLKLEKGKYFSGCIRNIQIGARPLGEPVQAVNVLPCSDEIEKGVFFGKGGGFVKLRDRFKVGTEMTIQFDIKPRTTDALLLSVHGKKASLLLELINGTIHFTVDNGDGPIVAKFIPDKGVNFCDGQWRSLTAIKSQYVITIMVDSVSSQPAIGNASNPSTDTSRPLYLGGHQFMSRVRGVTVRKPYIGCIRNIKIKDNVEHIHPSMTVGSVQTGVCPLL